MEKLEILESLKSLMKDLCPSLKIDYSKVTLNSKLKEDLKFDSLSMLLMAIGIEKKFNVQVGQLSFDSINKVSNIVNYIYEECK